MSWATAHPLPYYGTTPPPGHQARRNGDAANSPASRHGGQPRQPAEPAAARLADAVELRELRYFAAAARAGNLARAACDLNVTASAVSQQLRKLETELGTPLLLRHGRGVVATQAGARLLERIDAVLRLLNAPLGPEDPRAAPGGTVCLAIPAELAGLLAMPMLAALRRQLPELTTVIRENVDGGVDSWLLSGQVDLAILPDPTDLDELQIERLATEPLGVIVAPGSPLAETTRPLALRALDRLPLILPGKRHWIRRLLARAAFQHGARCEPVLQLDSLTMTKDMVRNGLGCTVLPAAAVRDEAARGTLVFRPLQQPALTATYAIAVAREAAPLLHDVARTIGDAILALAGSGDWPDGHPFRSAAPQTTGTSADDAAKQGRPVPRPAVAHDRVELAAGD